MSDLELIVVGGVVVGAAVELLGAAPPVAPPDPFPFTSKPTAGSTTGQQIGDNSDTAPGGVTGVGGSTYKRFSIAGLKMGSVHSVSTGSLVGSTGSGPGWYGEPAGWPQTSLPSGADPDTQQKIDQVNGACETFWDKADDAVRMKVAGQLNTTFQLNPPLTGKESWSELSQRCFEAAGRMGGQALGGAIAGPAGTYIGGMCGACLGGKVGDWINENAQGVYDWCKSKLSSLGDDVEDMAKSIYDDTLGAIF